jgi:hypothetical protein
MSRAALAARRQLLAATAHLQRTRLALDWHFMRQRARTLAHEPPVIALAALMAGLAAAAAWRRGRAASGSRLERAEALLRLLTRGLSLWRYWRSGSAPGSGQS